MKESNQITRASQRGALFQPIKDSSESPIFQVFFITSI